MKKYIVERKLILLTEVEAKNKNDAIEKAIDKDDWKMDDTCRNDTIRNCKAIITF